ncbi:MAG TPA: hypothetical protein VFS43_18695 [Polyangiaceae bacterium]|nr:hypothetical protein [Polyangiaceae bacterium]
MAGGTARASGALTSPSARTAGHAPDARAASPAASMEAAPAGANFQRPSRLSFSILLAAILRASGPRRMKKSLPFRWSISCSKARASSPSPLRSNQAPDKSWARTVTLFARLSGSRKVGTLRQPSGPLCSPSRATISGLTSTMRSERPSSQPTSITVRRLPMPICGAASPTPSASYIVSNMSSTSARSSSSKLVTGSVPASRA